MKRIKNRLIVIEGGDGAGKGTQCKLLLRHFRRNGVRTAYFDFPQYDKSYFGHIAGRALRGDFGDFRHLHPFFSSPLYMLDRGHALPKIVEAKKRGVVLCNRYTTSSMAFQATKLKGKAKKEIIEHIKRSEYVEIGLPVPDLVIYLHVPPTFSFEMIARKAGRNYLGGNGGARDQHERDKKYQIDTVKTYLYLVGTEPNWFKIDCVVGGRLLSPEEIHEKILELMYRVCA